MSGHPFTLDTSGVVPACMPTADPNILGPCGFHDLDPFTQGYVEAALRDVDLVAQWLDTVDPYSTPGFRHLAPETLATILKDCELAYGLAPSYWNEKEGGYFWRRRQCDDYNDFPPLTPYRGDDGKVYLKESAL